MLSEVYKFKNDVYVTIDAELAVELNMFTSAKVFFFAIRSNFYKLKTPDQWLWTCRQC